MDSFHENIWCFKSVWRKSYRQSTKSWRSGMWRGYWCSLWGKKDSEQFLKIPNIVLWNFPKHHKYHLYNVGISKMALDNSKREIVVIEKMVWTYPRKCRWIGNYSYYRNGKTSQWSKRGDIIWCQLSWMVFRRSKEKLRRSKILECYAYIYKKRFSTDQSRYKIVVVPVTSFVPVLNEWLQIPTTPDNFFSLSDNSKSYQHKRNRYNSNASWSCWNDYTLEFSKRNDSKKGLSCLKTT